MVCGLCGRQRTPEVIVCGNCFSELVSRYNGSWIKGMHRQADERVRTLDDARHAVHRRMCDRLILPRFFRKGALVTIRPPRQRARYQEDNRRPQSQFRDLCAREAQRLEDLLQAAVTVRNYAARRCV